MSKNESSQNYQRVICTLSPNWRVIVCKDDIQWIVQKRTGGSAERPWRAVRYFRTKEALTSFCAGLESLYGAIPEALSKLPDIYRNGYYERSEDN